MRSNFVVLAVVAATWACAPARSRQAPAPARDTTVAAPGLGATSIPNADPFPSTYVRFPAAPLVIRNVNILTAAGPMIPNGAVSVVDGKIVSVGATVDVPPGAIVLDGTGRFLTPGLIDTHSHVGAGGAPGTQANSDVNEGTNPSTPYVWVEHSVWPQDPQLPRELSGGVTTLQVLPGSANLIGGRSSVLKVVPARTAQGMKFPGAGTFGIARGPGEHHALLDWTGHGGRR